MAAAAQLDARPSQIRYVVLALTTMVAVLLYLDRICLSYFASNIQEDLGITESQMAFVLSSFYWTYALAQLPAGWLSDRFGARLTLAFYLAIWSAFTGFLGFAYGLVALVALRLGCGLFEAGAYPAAVGIVGHWIPFHQRGLASGIVSVGGRLGGAVVSPLSGLLLVAFGAWRPVLVVYGVLGLIVAGIFWWFFRDSPRQHAECNASEIALIEGDGGRHDHKALPPPLPFACFLSSGGLWISSMVQMLTNLGWAFLITWLPRYLGKTYDVPPITLGFMTGIPIAIGILGMLGGGWLTDAMTARLGRRWGRAAPLALTRFVVAAAFALAIFLDSPWTITMAMSLVALGTDLGTPAIWAYSMDVGGKHVGSVLGWSNMFGNAGAALSPILLSLLLENYGPAVMFLACALALVLAGVLSLFLDATKPVVPVKCLA